MKLIDEKIKALGLTKGQYCKKYGFKFKDFAAKVHTLEAKLEWANTFLKPLGLRTCLVSVAGTAGELDTSAFSAGDILYIGSEPRGIVEMGQELVTKIKNDTGAKLADGAAVHVSEGKVKRCTLPEWCKAGSSAEPNCDQFCRAEEADSGCSLDNRNDADSLL